VKFNEKIRGREEAETGFFFFGLISYERGGSVAKEGKKNASAIPASCTQEEKLKTGGLEEGKGGGKEWIEKTPQRMRRKRKTLQSNVRKGGSRRRVTREGVRGPEELSSSGDRYARKQGGRSGEGDTCRTEKHAFWRRLWGE